MNRITADFYQQYQPKQVLIFYRHSDRNTDLKEYVESGDITDQGTLINLHPLSEQEAVLLGKTLYSANTRKTSFLKPAGLLPTSVLHIDPNPETGYVVWYTRPQKRPLYFIQSLSIPEGNAYVPAMIWKATKRGLSVMALGKSSRPTTKSLLYLAPFFNTSGQGGGVCMGSAGVTFPADLTLDTFIATWEYYFFHSRFSHLLGGTSPTKGNIVQLWTDLIQSGEKFPTDQLKKSTLTLQQFIQ